MSRFKTFFRNTDNARHTLAALVLRGIGAIALLVVTLVVTRTLSASQAGLFFLGVSGVMVMMPIGLMGLNVSVLRFTSVAHAKGDSAAVRGLDRLALIWATAMLATLALAVWLARTNIAADVFSKPALGPVLAFIAPAALLVGLNALRAQQLLAVGRAEVGLFALFVGLPGVLCAGFFVLKPEDATGAASIYLVSIALVLAFSSQRWRATQRGRVRGAFDATLLWQTTWPLWIIAIAGLGTRWGGQFLSGVWLQSHEIAYLAAAERTALLVMFVNIAIMPVYQPRFARAHEAADDTALRRAVWQAVAVSGAIGVPVALVALAMPEWLMSVFGAQYTAAAPLLMIFAVGFLVSALCGVSGSLLIMSGYEKDMRNLAVCTSLAVLAALVLVVPRFGAIGAAGVLSTAMALQAICAAWLVYWRLSINVLSPRGITGVVRQMLADRLHKPSGQTKSLSP